MNKECVFCKEEKAIDLIVLGKGICSDCNYELSNTKIDDHKYDELIKGVKKILQFG